MTLFLWMIAGLMMGWLSSLLLTTKSHQGTVTDVVLGVVGAMVGGALMSILGQPTVSGFSFYNLAVATLGAVLLIWMGRILNSPADYR